MVEFTGMISNNHVTAAHDALKIAIEHHGSTLIRYDELPFETQQKIERVVKYGFDRSPIGVQAIWNLLHKQYNMIQPEHTET